MRSGVFGEEPAVHYDEFRHLGDDGARETRRWAEAELGPLQQTVRLRREVILHYRREMGVAT